MRNDRNDRAAASLAMLLFALTMGAAAPAQDAKIDFQTLSVAPSLGLPDGHFTRAIRSQRDWNAWVDNLSQVTEPLPTVDFERYTLLVASAGFKMHGPVVVTFDSVIDTGNVIRVHVSVSSSTACPKEPQPGHFAAMALIPHTDKLIQFDVTSRESECPYS